MSSSNVLAKAAVLAGVVLLSACTTLYDGRYNFADGWREGTVDTFMSLDQVERKDLHQCKNPTSQSGEVWAVVRYVRSGHMTTYAVPAPKDTLKLEQKVYVNPWRECAGALGLAKSDEG